MDFSLNEDQKMIADTVREFVKRELPIERMRKMRSDDIGFNKAVWKQMGELGWLGIALPESVGGFGGTFVDASIVIERFGTTLVSEPYTESAIVAATALLSAGNDAQHQRWLAPMVSGDTTLALAWAEAGHRYNAAGCSTRAEPSGSGWKLQGEKVWVLNGHAADQLIVSAATGDAISLFVIDGDHAGLERRTLKTMDGRFAAALSIDCEVDADRLLGDAGGGLGALEKALDFGAAAACSEAAGIMKTALGMTIEYLKTREQFGRKIGVFQALQHRAVDMFVETQLAKSVAVMAAIKADDDDETERKRAISSAKAQVSVSGKFVTQQAIQLHGGIGVTDEHDIGLYFKRMHALNVLYGDEKHHVERYMSLPSFLADIDG
jgi:alkylation response protein AidB-like acyl-CoA dehydrogenase